MKAINTVLNDMIIAPADEPVGRRSVEEIVLAGARPDEMPRIFRINSDGAAAMRVGCGCLSRGVPFERIAARRLSGEGEFGGLAGREFCGQAVTVQMQLARGVARDAQLERVAFFDFEQALRRRNRSIHDGQFERFFGHARRHRAAAHARGNN